jgi:hypothetical protein
MVQPVLAMRDDIVYTEGSESLCDSLSSVESIRDDYLIAAQTATDKFLLHKGGHEISGLFCMVSIYTFSGQVYVEIECPSLNRTMKTKVDVNFSDFSNSAAAYDTC